MDINMNSGALNNFSDGKNAAVKLQFKGKADGEVRFSPDFRESTTRPNITNLLQHDAVQHGRQNSTKSTAMLERGLFFSPSLSLSKYSFPSPSLIIDKSIDILDEQVLQCRKNEFGAMEISNSGDGEGIPEPFLEVRDWGRLQFWSQKRGQR